MGQGLATIKAHMPQTYAEIQRQAQARGNAVFGLVRRGCSGQADCFYAVEAGHVVGTPFAQSDVTDQVARLMVGFGCGFLVMLSVTHAAPTPPVGTPGAPRPEGNSSPDLCAVTGGRKGVPLHD